MDFINLLPSPPHFFGLFFRLAISLFKSAVNANHRRTVDVYHSPIDFDIDAQTGFFPRQPLPHLPEQFETWEVALVDANGSLSLGENDSDEAIEKRHFGEAWRSNIASVSGRLV